MEGLVLKLIARERKTRWRKAQKAAWHLNNRVKVAARNASHYRANPEKKKAQVNAYKLKNPDKIKAYRKAHHRESCISGWIYAGVKLRPTETWNGVYDKYMATKNCESCDIELDDNYHITRRNLDHLHGGFIRGTICHSCNTMDQWRKHMTPYSTYQQYL